MSEFIDKQTTEQLAKAAYTEIAEIVFDKPSVDEAEDAIRTLIKYIGEPLDTPDTKDTPKRVIKAWREYWGAGYNIEDLSSLVTAFPDPDKEYDEMVLVKDIPVYSTCAHHLAPIVGKAHIAYIPNGAFIGLSKFVRIAEVYTRRLQLQERMTAQICQAFEDLLKPLGVAVYIEAEHMCMSSRGVKVHGSVTVTSKLTGAFKNNPATRAEFMAMVKA